MTESGALLRRGLDEHRRSSRWCPSMAVFSSGSNREAPIPRKGGVTWESQTGAIRCATWITIQSSQAADFVEGGSKGA